jgi:acyl-CoA thioesterase FadM
MSTLVFSHSHRVTYSECTVGNHIYYSRYLDILEAARGEFFRQAPARYDDLLTIETWLTAIERIRLNFAYRILKDQTLLLEGETFHVCTGLDEKAKRLPDELCSLLKPYLHAPS